MKKEDLNPWFESTITRASAAVIEEPVDALTAGLEEFAVGLKTQPGFKITNRPGRRRFSIYVIELDREVLRTGNFKAANPNYRPGRPCFYVGMTARTPEERFRQHKSGYKASRVVKRFGLHLKPRLYARFNPMTYEMACYVEEELPKLFRKHGFGAWQN